MTYFFDSHAIIEVVKGSANNVPFKAYTITTTDRVNGKLHEFHSRDFLRKSGDLFMS